MRAPPLSLALLPLLLAAVPARAQDTGARPFPGIAWGVDADSVVRVWGEPDDRKSISRGLEELDYVEGDEASPVIRYIMVHPTLGTVIAGYTALFEDSAGCRDAAVAAVREIGRAYPRLAWNAGVAPRAEAVCASGEKVALGRDPESGTHVSLRLSREGTGLVADAISPAGFAWISTDG